MLKGQNAHQEKLRESSTLHFHFDDYDDFFFPQGKLGHGDTNRVYKPKVIDGLQGLVIKKVCCGSQFSLALTSTGLVSGIFWMKYGLIRHVQYSLK